MDQVRVTQDLLARVRKGDREAAAQLIEHSEGYVLSLARARLGPGLRRWLESTDIRQQALLEVHRSLATFEREDGVGFLRWLAVLVENVIRERARYWRAERRRASGLHPHGGLLVEGYPGQGRTPSAEAVAGESGELVRESLQDLPEGYRDVLLLRSENASWAEVGMELGLTEGAARMLYSRALVRLGAQLGSRGLGS